MSKKSFIDSVEVKSPCTEDWAKMHGGYRVRFCDHCAKDVTNLSAVTRKEAMRLVRSSGGDLCIRYIQDPVTKRPIFAEQLLQITRRTPAIAAGVMSASMSLSTMAYAQGEPARTPALEPVNSCPDKSQKADDAKPAKTQIKGKLMGTITDPNGAVVPFAAVSITSIDARMGEGRSADQDGMYTFDGLAAGTYRVEAQAPGFTSRATEATVKDGYEASADIQLAIEINEVVEVVAGTEGQVSEGGMGGAMTMVEYRTPLARAVADENVDLVRELIAKGENVNGKDENYDKITPVFVAVEHGNIEIVQLLLDAGAKLNARDSDGQTPLMRLDDDATPELVEMLLRNGAKVNLTDNENNTVLMFAADRAPTEVLKALVDAGADVNVINKDGQTALMNAAVADSPEKVRTLLEAGAKVSLKNNEDKTAWDIASNEEIREMLVSYGAEAKPEPVESSAEPQEVSVPDGNI